MKLKKITHPNINFNLVTTPPENAPNNAERMLGPNLKSGHEMKEDYIENVHSRIGYQTWMSFPEYSSIQKKVCTKIFL